MKTPFWKWLLPLQIVLCAGSLGYAQQSQPQLFMMTVPGSATIEGMHGQPIELIYDESQEEQRFPLQRWTVVSSNINGVEVSFEVHPFLHDLDTSFKSDAKISVSLIETKGPAIWSFQNSFAQTDHVADESATATVVSDAPGRAVFDIALTCLLGSAMSVPEGKLHTQVVATITAL